MKNGVKLVIWLGEIFLEFWNWVGANGAEVFLRNEIAVGSFLRIVERAL